MAIPVFFTPRQVADARSFSPSAAKPAAVVASWQRLSGEILLVEPEPLTRAQLALAHDRRFVDDVLDGRRENGFGNRSPEVAAALPYTSGAMYAAAVHALDRGGVAAAPVSGFHHAYWGSCGGFCTFNGLVITAQLLKQDHAVDRVGILDFDQHEGDGTADILRKLKLDWVSHHTAGAFHCGPDDAERFLDGIPDVLRRMRAGGCDVILYQAGADPHVLDPLGGFLTTEQLERRDRLVFTTARALDLPIAWNLAGGYQVRKDGSLRPVLDIHDHTMQACFDLYDGPRSAAFRHRDVPVDADEIVPGLWQGAFPEEAGEVARAGFDVLVLCAQELQPAAETFPGVHVVHAPNADSDDLTPEQLQAARSAARTVIEASRSGKRVLVTCAAGLNRSGLVVAMALSQLGGGTAEMERHIRRVRERRPGALNNEHFVAVLRGG